MDFSITTVRQLPLDELAFLIAESEREVLSFVRRMADEWRLGNNRFDRPGEKFFVASLEGTVIGICGLNIDPYISDLTVGRVRRLYVLPEYRANGVGQRLLQAVMDAARGRFAKLRVRTNNPQAGRLYERHGFIPVCDVVDTTHVIDLV